MKKSLFQRQKKFLRKNFYTACWKQAIKRRKWTIKKRKLTIKKKNVVKDATIKESIKKTNRDKKS